MRISDIEKKLNNDFKVIYKKSTGSTNDDLKNLLRSGCGLNILEIADYQYGGRGRFDRNFFSPSNTGLYFSFSLMPKDEEREYLTVLAAVAVSHAIKNFFKVAPEIKWVNDIYLNQKKCAGILCESVIDGNGKYLGAIVGIGINIRKPENGFPDSISQSAGWITDNYFDKKDDFLCEIINLFFEMQNSFNKTKIIEDYKLHSCVIGKKVKVCEINSQYFARVVDIDDKCRLIVEQENGEIVVLDSADVFIRQ